jgi:hypothetical protein
MTFVPEQGVLVVGGQTALLDARPPLDTVVGTYVELVVAQRAIRPSGRGDLRDWELAELANLLHLPSDELDALIDRELDRLLGRVDESPNAPGERRRRRLIAATALALATAVAIGAAAASGETAPADPPPAGPTVETVQLPDGSTATRTESAPAPPGEGVDIGTAVEYER